MAVSTSMRRSLPRWRGAAPIARALLAGDRQTGISIMQMDAGLDTGPVVTTRVVPIAPARHGADACMTSSLRRVASAIVETLHKLDTSEHLVYGATTRRRRDVREQDRAQRGCDRLDRRCGGHRSQGPCVQPLSRGTDDACRRGRSRSGRRNRPPGASALPDRSCTPMRAALSSRAATAHWSCASCSALARRRLSAAAFLAGHPLAPNAQFGT